MTTRTRRVVAWLKIILPLLALAILSTLFLVARTIDPAKNIPYADVDIEELTREQRIGNPNYSGVTADGTAIRLKARQAKPDPMAADRIIGTDIDATLDLPDGTSYDVTVRQPGTRQHPATAPGWRRGVLITSGDEIEIRTEALELALETTRVDLRHRVRREGRGRHPDLGPFRDDRRRQRRRPLTRWFSRAG